ncbi:hypothetical protein EPN29_12160 [bacterium]|nr:MAG: hypothetical protein EPN29_12160 [bacterium]
MTRLTSIIVLSALLVACEAAAQPVPTPSPSPTPHTSPSVASLQPGDVPTGLNACLGSGPIDVYLTNLAAGDAPLATRVEVQWLHLRAAGALDAAISLFAANPSACNVELAATPDIKAAASFVAVFADAGQAERAWESGVFGLVPPARGELPPGLNRGTVTGLGLSSWTYDHAPLRLACWHRSVFVALVAVSNLDATAFKTATAAVDARLN